MTASQGWFLALLGAVALERVFELWLSRRNAAWARARGGLEVGERHFRVMSLMHSAFFVACAAEVVLMGRTFPGVAGWLALGVAAAAQGLRYWAIAALGPRWNVRIIVLPGEAPVVGGPYRFLRHPNYLAVCLELAVLPLVHGAYLTAVVFTVLNAWMLRVRIRAEERALGEGYAAAFARTPRFIPARSRHG